MACEILSNDYTEDLLEDYEDYSTFSATIDGNNVLDYDDTDLDKLQGKTLA
jgi:hypothetical protein